MTDLWTRNMTAARYEMRLGFAALGPRAFPVISMVADSDLATHDRFGYPLWPRTIAYTRCTLGAREAARDRRRHR